MSFGGGSSSGNIHSDGDVALNNPSDGQMLSYNASLQKWQNQAVPAPTTGATAGTVAAGNDPRIVAALQASSGSGVKVWITTTDPGSAAAEGDIWING